MSLGKGLVEISGPLMRAWVRIPLLTTNLLGILMKKKKLFTSNSFEFSICWFNVSSTSRFVYKVFFKTCDCLSNVDSISFLFCQFSVISNLYDQLSWACVGETSWKA